MKAIIFSHRREKTSGRIQLRYRLYYYSNKEKLIKSNLEIQMGVGGCFPPPADFSVKLKNGLHIERSNFFTFSTS